MKTRLVIFLTTMIFTAFVFSGCASESEKSEEYIFASDMVKYDLEGVEDFGFNVNFLSRNKDVDIEFVSFEGENTQGLAVQLKDDTYDYIKELNHNGYYIRLLGFVCKTGDEYVEIDSVNLKIDGVEKKFDFSVPIKHYVKKNTDDSHIYALNYPIFISTNSYSSTEYNFQYTAGENLTVEDFGFNDFLSIKSGSVSIDGAEVGDLSSFPLSLKKDSVLLIKCYLDFEDPENTTDYDGIYCDSVLSYKYTTSDSEQLLSLRNNLVSQSVSNEDDAKNVIDYLLK